MKCTFWRCLRISLAVAWVWIAFHGAALGQTAAGGESVFVADNFDDNFLSSDWVKNAVITGEANSQLPVNEVNTRLEIGPLVQNNSGTVYNGISTRASFNFSGAQAFVRLVQPTSTAGTDAYAMFAVGRDSSNYYRWYVLNGTSLVAQKRIAGTKTVLATIPYDATNHRYLRIRHNAATGQVVYETAAASGSGPGSWTSRHSESWNSTAVPLASVALELKAGTTGVQAGAPGTVIFDDFRSGVPITETVTLTDLFATSTLDTAKWSVSVLSGYQDSTISVAQPNGTLEIGPLKENVEGSHYNGILSSNVINLTDSYASVQAVVAPSASSGAYGMFTLPVDGSNHYRILVSNGSLSFEKKIGNVKTLLATIPFSVANHGYWRIRHIGSTDQITFETAPAVAGSPGAWTVRAGIGRELNVSSLRYELKGGTSVAGASPGKAIFDNVRVTGYSTNALPSVTLTAPTNGASYLVSSTVALAATATDTDGTVSKVEFFVGGALLQTDVAAPYQASWSPGASGTYTLTAKATDNKGAITTSASSTVTVSTSTTNAAPSINLTAPSTGSSYVTSTPVTLAATAADADGSVSKVEFFVNGGLYQTDTASPYQTSWSPTNSGMYTLSARATDNVGATATSPVASVTVNAPTTCTYAISPESTEFGSASRTSSFSVTVAGGCSWQAASQATWLTTSSAGNGSGSVTFTIDSNVSNLTRTGEIQVGGRTFTVSQSGVQSYTASSEVPFNQTGFIVGYATREESGLCQWVPDAIQDPLFYQYSRDNDQWWYNMLEEAAFANAAFVAVGVRGDSPCPQPPVGDAPSKYLDNLTAALDRRGYTDILKVALWDDTAHYRGMYGQCNPGHGDTFDIGNAAARDLYIWQNKWFKYFDKVKPQYRMLVKDRPLVAMWTTGEFANVTDENLRDAINELRAKTNEYFGVNPFIVVEQSWTRNGNCPGGVCTQTERSVDGVFKWFNPAVPADYATKTIHTMGPSGSFTIGHTIPGFDASSHPSTSKIARQNGATFRTNLQEAFDGSNLVLLEGLTDIEENAGYYRGATPCQTCNGLPTTNCWAYPNQYLNIVREFSASTDKYVVFEAEAADDYYTPGAGEPSGENRFRRPGPNRAPFETTFSSPNHGQWAVRLGPGEWVKFRQVPTGGSANWTVRTQYKSIGGATARLTVAGVTVSEFSLPPNTDFGVRDLTGVAFGQGAADFEFRIMSGEAWIDSWTIDGIGQITPNPAPGSYMVSLQSANGPYVVAEDGGGGIVRANRPAIGAWETFEMVDLNGGELNHGDQVTFKASGGLYLQAELGGAPTAAMLAIGPTPPAAWETFTIEKHNGPGIIASGDTIALRSSEGYYASAELGGMEWSSEAVVNVNRASVGGAWELFTLRVQRRN